ncbi:MAG: metallophosphoesterase [Clostridia bacterium]|nr:metallophosphoesterase [Clostridia bacterium]
MKLLLIPLLVGIIAYSSRFVYKVLIRFVKMSMKMKIIASVCVGVAIFAMCMFVGGIFLAIVAHMLMLFLVADIILLIFKVPCCQKFDPSAFKHFDKIFSVGLLILAILMSVWGYFNATDIQATKYSVSFEDKVYEDTRVMFVSDIHANDSNIKRITEAISETYRIEKPNVIIVGGDLTDSSTSWQNAKEISAFFGSMTDEVPVIFVYGNHDIMGGDDFSSHELGNLLERNGITVLCDDVYEMNGICFVGRNEYYSQSGRGVRADIQSLVPGNGQNATVVIDHQPKDLEKLGSIGVDMSLSGHTHNGQIFPLGHICNLFGVNEMQYGMKRFGSNTAIVSSGVGTWGMNVRTQGVSEIVIVDITKA